jgi:phospholipid/cholesterol/gamma-HCH transport system substrate-binding protein
MKKLGTEFKVGLFTIVAALTTGYMFFILSPESFESKDRNVYYTILDDAAGIIAKTQVKTNGVTVGKVKSVELQTNRTRIEMEVDATVKIPKGSKVERRTRGLLGDVFIEIVRVKDSGEYIPSESYLPLSDDQVDVQQLIALGGSIFKDIKLVTNSLSAVLGGERGAQTVANLIADIQEIASNTKGIVKDNKDDIRAMMANLEKTTETLRLVIGDNRQDLNLIVSNIKQSTADLKEFSGSVRELVTGENREKFDRIIASFDQTMGDVEKTAKNVALVSNKLEKGEGTLGRLINDDTAISELEGAIKDIRDVIKPASKLQVAVDYHGEFQQTGHSQHYFNMLFKTRPDRYYLLGFTDFKESVTRTKPTTEDGYTVIRTEEKPALRFNAQYAKRWFFAQVRFGLFESTGGLAADLYAWRDRIHVAFEAFDWNNTIEVRRTAHLKSYVSILFFNHIYTMLGVDDPTKTDVTGKVLAKKEPFFGAGFSFNDDDLKAIFGTAALAR